MTSRISGLTVAEGAALDVWERGAADTMQMLLAVRAALTSISEQVVVAIEAEQPANPDAASKIVRRIVAMGSLRLDRIIDRVVGPCIEWSGRRDRHGYGRRSGHLAHRLAWIAANGHIPDKLTVDHLCRNHGCINVDHMRLIGRPANASQRRNRTANGKCKKGHFFTPSNTRMTTPKPGKNAYRVCLTCERAASVRCYQRKLQRLSGKEA